MTLSIKKTLLNWLEQMTSSDRTLWHKVMSHQSENFFFSQQVRYRGSCWGILHTLYGHFCWPRFWIPIRRHADATTTRWQGQGQRSRRHLAFGSEDSLFFISAWGARTCKGHKCTCRPARCCTTFALTWGITGSIRVTTRWTTLFVYNSPQPNRLVWVHSFVSALFRIILPNCVVLTLCPYHILIVLGKQPWYFKDCQFNANIMDNRYITAMAL